MKANKKRSNKIKVPFGAKIICVFLIIYAALLLYPYLLALNSSLRDWGEFTDNVFGISRWTLDNFIKVFKEFNYPVTMPDGTPGKTSRFSCASLQITFSIPVSPRMRS